MLNQEQLNKAQEFKDWLEKMLQNDMHGQAATEVYEQIHAKIQEHLTDEQALSLLVEHIQPCLTLCLALSAAHKDKTTDMDSVTGRSVFALAALQLFYYGYAVGREEMAEKLGSGILKSALDD